jgi:glycine/serine hydroxymethyltransferase
MTTTLPEEQFSIRLNASENPAAKRLLDVIVSILTEEYIQKAKETPEIFSD